MFVVNTTTLRIMGALSIVENMVEHTLNTKHPIQSSVNRN